MAKINIDDATATQLALFCNTHLGITDVTFRAGKDALRAKIAQAGYTSPTIEVDDSAPAASPAPTASVDTAVAAAPRKMVKILIQNQPGVGGKDHVPVGVNGKVVRIKRGVPVDVPAEYVHALENANRVVYDSGPNGEPINPTLVPTHPFSILAA